MVDYTNASEKLLPASSPAPPGPTMTERFRRPLRDAPMGGRRDPAFVDVREALLDNF